MGKIISNKQKHRRVNKAMIPSLFTIVNMFFGFLSILASMRGEFHLAAMYIIYGALFDSVDGKIARALNSTSDFGIQFDSLADIITFCAAPAVFVYMVWARPLDLYIGGFFAFIPLMMGVIRLAKFNIEAENDQKAGFIGIPTPLAAMTIVGIYLFFSQLSQYPFLHWTPHVIQGNGRTVLPFIMLISFLMISKIPFPKFPPITFIGKESWKFYLLLVLIISIFYTNGFTLMPISLLIILGGIIKWTSIARMEMEYEKKEDV